MGSPIVQEWSHSDTWTLRPLEHQRGLSQLSPAPAPALPQGEPRGWGLREEAGHARGPAELGCNMKPRQQRPHQPLPPVLCCCTPVHPMPPPRRALSVHLPRSSGTRLGEAVWTLWGRDQDTATQQASWAWGCHLPAFPHYCSLSGHLPLLGINQGTSLLCQLPSRHIWQVASMFLSLSFPMNAMGIIKLRGSKQSHLQTGPHTWHKGANQPCASHTAGTAPLLPHSPQGPSADSPELPRLVPTPQGADPSGGLPCCPHTPHHTQPIQSPTVCRALFKHPRMTFTESSPRFWT